MSYQDLEAAANLADGLEQASHLRQAVRGLARRTV